MRFKALGRARALGLGLLLSAAAPAQAAGWDDLGGLLQQACSANSVAGVAVNTGETLKWVCQLRSMHAFISNNIINGDWQGFAKDVVGKYAGEFLGQLGEYLGVGQLNAYTEKLNEALRGNYTQFRSAMYGAVNDIMKARQDANAPFPKDTAGGIAATAIHSNPNLALGNRLARLQDAMAAADGLEKSFKAKKTQDEATKALEANTAGALSNATSVIGIPGVKVGVADRLAGDAATALSAREVAEIQVRLGAEQMKQDATMSVALLNQLSEVVQQQVMTNTHLLMERNQREEEMVSQEEQLNREVETLAQENVDAAVENGQNITGAYANAASVFKTGETLDFAGAAP